MQAIKNLDQSQANLLRQVILYLRSAPGNRSITRQRLSRSLKAQTMFAMKPEFISQRIFLSFSTFSTDFFIIIKALLIYFIAKHLLLLTISTFQTLPQPPSPITSSQLKSLRHSLSSFSVVSFVFSVIEMSRQFFFYGQYTFVSIRLAFGEFFMEMRGLI